MGLDVSWVVGGSPESGNVVDRELFRIHQRRLVVEVNLLQYLRFDMNPVRMFILVVDRHALQASFNCTDSHDFCETISTLMEW